MKNCDYYLIAQNKHFFVCLYKYYIYTFNFTLKINNYKCEIFFFTRKKNKDKFKNFIYFIIQLFSFLFVKKNINKSKFILHHSVYKESLLDDAFLNINLNTCEVLFE